MTEDLKPLNDPKIQGLFLDAILGACALGYQDSSPPPPGHWLQRAWDMGRGEAMNRERLMMATESQLVRAGTFARNEAGEWVEVPRDWQGATVLFHAPGWPGRQAGQGAHADDEAVDRFAEMLKDKLAKAREKGRSGWADPAWPASDINRQMHEHAAKGDPLDVAAYAMFLALRGEAASGAAAPATESAPKDVAADSAQSPGASWKLVPCEPTEAMVQAAVREMFKTKGYNEPWEEAHRRCYIAALAVAPAAPPAAPVALTDERLDYIADLIVKGMPDGIQGFAKAWGWRQYARALLADCAGFTWASVPLTDAQIDAAVFAQCPDFNSWHEGPSIDDLRAIVRAALAAAGVVQA